MSISWSFVSISPDAAAKVFGPGDRDMIDAIRDALSWEHLYDAKLVEQYANAICSRELSETPLDGMDFETYGDVMCALLSPEGLEQLLQLESESPDFISRRTFEELASQCQSEGRESQLQRFVSNKLVLILSKDDMETLKDEAQQAIDSDKEWSDDVNLSSVKEDLIDVMDGILKKEKIAVAIYS